MDKFNKMKEGGVLKYEDGKKVDPAILEHMKRQGIVLPSPKNEQVSADNRTKELKEAQQRDIKTRQLGNNLKQFGTDTRNQLGTILSFTNPSFGLALGLGDAAIAATNGNYIEGGVQAGLEVLPFVGKTVSKGIKLIPKRNILSKQFIKDLNNATNIKDYATMGKQNQTFQEGIDEVTQMWNGSTDMSNFTRTNSPSGVEYIQYKLDPNIKRRAEIAEFKQVQHPAYNIDENGDVSRYFMYDNLGNNHTSYKGELDVPYAKGYFTDNPNHSGLSSNKDAYNYIIAKRYDKNSKLYTPQNIKDIATHEGAHTMQRLYGITLDSPRLKGEYGKLNPNTPIGKKLDKFINKSNEWTSSGDEMHAELWSFRNKMGIGTRDLTDEEVKDFIAYNGRLFNRTDYWKDTPKELLEVIKMMPVVAPIMIGSKMLNKENDERGIL